MSSTTQVAQSMSQPLCTLAAETIQDGRQFGGVAWVASARNCWAIGGSMGDVIHMRWPTKSGRTVNRKRLLPKDFPGNVGAQLFASHNVVSGLRPLAGEALDGGAVLGRNAALCVEPGPDTGAPLKAKTRCECGLTAQHLRCALKGGLFGGGSVVHDEVYVTHTSSVNDAHTRGRAMVYLAQMDSGTDGEIERKEEKRQLGQRLKAARVDSGKTQAEAGELLGVNKATVSSWEIGNNIPDSLTLAKLARLYSTTADALLFGSSLSAQALQYAGLYDSTDAGGQERMRNLLEIASSGIPRVAAPAQSPAPPTAKPKPIKTIVETEKTKGTLGKVARKAKAA